MKPQPDDICAERDRLGDFDAESLAPPIYPASVYVCQDAEQAESLLGGEQPGYVYQRDGHPNADLLAEKCRELHGAQHAAITSSGMAALSLCVLSQLEQGDHVVVSRMLYGLSLRLLTSEAARLGVDSTVVDTCDLAATAQAFTARTRLLVVETISNPQLRVADIAALSELAGAHDAVLLVDNTFASPVLCQPLYLGSHLTLESISKIVNGHSDVILGLLAGYDSVWERVPRVLSAWGLAASPFDCWLATRGLSTLHLRIERASENASAAAAYLADSPGVARVDYPGLDDHPDHALACQQFGDRFGWMVTFHLAGGRPAADAFIQAARRIPFCPSLGELSTTLSHPRIDQPSRVVGLGAGHVGNRRRYDPSFCRLRISRFRPGRSTRGAVGNVIRAPRLVPDICEPVEMIKGLELA